MSSLRRQPQAPANFPGQHFLSDRRLARHLVGLAESNIVADHLAKQVLERPKVLDIGAGAGALTIPLAERGWHVVAIECNQALAQGLRDQLASAHNVQVVCRDFLRVPLPTEPFAVVASIPFSITTEVMGRLMDRPASGFLGGVIVVEPGAALRFSQSALVGLRILGWRTWFEMEILRVVPAQSFVPPPRVDAAALRIRRRAPALVPVRAHGRFMGMVAQCRAEPSLPVAKALRCTFTTEQVRRLTHDLRADRGLPVGLLAAQDWATVYRAMCQYVPPYRWPRAYAH